MNALVSGNPEEAANAVAELSSIAAEAFGQDAADLAAHIRQEGGMVVLVECMQNPSEDVQQCAMSLLGNLLTDVFVPDVLLSLTDFAAEGGLVGLQQKLLSDFPINLYAAAALQNVTALDPQQCCADLRAQGATEALSQLLEAGDERVRILACERKLNARGQNRAATSDAATRDAFTSDARASDTHGSASARQLLRQLAICAQHLPSAQ